MRQKKQGGRLKNRILQNGLMQSLLNMKGNARTLIYIEPLWGIPFNLIAPFATLYMNELGVDDVQIGILISIAMVTQFFFACIAGVVADKLGRKRTTMIGDFIGWTLPCLIWAVSQNVWFFLAAMVLNSLEQVNQTAWNCLMVEDADWDDTVNLYTWVSIGGLVSVFFAPISGLLILHFASVVPLMRGLYLFYACSMIVKNLITWKYTKETKQGRIRMAETKGVPFLTLLAEYRVLSPVFFRNKMLRATLILVVLLNTAAIVNSNFFALYVKDSLGVPEQYLAFFPILRSVLMMLLMFLVLPRLTRLRLQIPMGTGLAAYIAAQLLLICSPAQNIAVLAVYTILEAVAIALVMPRKDSMLVLYVDEKERARSVSLLGAISLVITAPFGSIIGFLSGIDRKYPFVFSVILYVAAFGVVLWMKEPAREADAVSGK